MALEGYCGKLDETSLLTFDTHMEIRQGDQMFPPSTPNCKHLDTRGKCDKDGETCLAYEEARQGTA